jgi:FkbM family methyltransferase
MLASLRVEERWRLAREYCFYWRSCRNWRAVLRGRREGLPFDRFEFRSGSVITFPAAPRNHVYTRCRLRITQPRVVVDIGANIGSFALYAASRWPQASIHAYEPAPDNVARLTLNVGLSRASRVVCHPSAVGGSSGMTTLYLKADPGWHSIWDEGAETAIDVAATDLDEIADQLDGQPIDFLKLDCEGAEYEILEGRESLLRKQVQQIAMEYHEVGGHTVKELTTLLDHAGFQCEIAPAPKWKTGMLYAVNRARAI